MATVQVHSSIRWTGEGILSRWTKPKSRPGESRAYLRGSELSYFLSHVKEGVPFAAHSLPYKEDFKQSHFYVILSWLQHHDLVSKEPSSHYLIVEKEHIIAQWNKEVEKMKL